MVIKQIIDFQYDVRDFEKFLHFCKNYLSPETINSYIETEQYDSTGPEYTFSLLDRVINICMELSNEFTDKLFELFDSAGFVYTNPQYTHLMYHAIESLNIRCIEKLIERGVIIINHPIIIDSLFDKMRNQIISFHTCTELNMTRINIYSKTFMVSTNDKINCEFYKYIIQRPELIKEFFTDNETDDENRTKIIKKKILDIVNPFELGNIFDFVENFNCNNNRMNHFIREESLSNYIKLYQTLSKYGFNFEQTFTQIMKPTDKYIQLKPMTLYELYTHGSYPIQVMYPDHHQKLKSLLIHSLIFSVKKFKNIPIELTELVISWV